MSAPPGRWTDVFRAFRLAMDPRKLWVAFRGLVLSLVLVSVLLALVAWLYHARGVEAGPPDGWRALWEQGRVVEATRDFAVALVTSPPSLATVLPLAGAELLVLLVWTYYGVVLIRLMAVEYARGEPVELASAQAYARRKQLTLLGSLLGPVVAAALLGIAMAFVGLIAANCLAAAVLLLGILATGLAAAVVTDRARSSLAGLAVAVVGMAVSVGLAVLLVRGGVRVPWVGEVAAGLLSPLVFVAALLVVVLVLWDLFGSALMFGAVGSDDADVFEAWSRSFHYLFTRPWRYAFLVGMMVVYGVACLGFVLVVRVGAEWAAVGLLSTGLLGHYEVAWDVGGARLTGPDTAGTSILAFVLSANRLLLDLAVLSFWAAFKCAAVTLIYFLMRRRADGTPMDQVHLEPRDRELLEPRPDPEQG